MGEGKKMLDPYRVLGIDRSASEEDIKKAYRRLSRKYHPDANINNPNKAQAEEKFKEVQQAYDQIMKERETGGSYGGFTSGQSTWQDEEDMRRQAAANYIQNAHYREAMNVLEALTRRNGQWYYLRSMANMGLGNNVNALSDIKEAVRQEPQNMQYRMLLDRMENGGGGWYEQRQRPFGGMPVSDDNMCMNICLANLACSLCCPGGGMFFCI